VISVGSSRLPVAVKWLFNLVILAVVLALLFFVWLRVVRTLTATVDKPAPVGKPKAFAWGDRVFSSQAQLEAWLKERGISYSVWARRHPAAIGVVAPGSVGTSTPSRTAAKHTVTSSPAAKVAPSHSTPATRVATSANVGSSSASWTSRVAIGVLWAFVLSLAAVAVAPRQLAMRASIYWLGPEQRMMLGAAAGAFAVGLLVSSWAS
jgi:hypothetical protein